MSGNKTVGIATIHRIYNYGSALQTYALQTSINRMGYGCEVIDYIYPNDSNPNMRSHADNQCGPARRVKTWLADLLTGRNKKQVAFDVFMKKFIRLSPDSYSSFKELQHNPPQYDVYVSGSDQVWNPKYLGDDPTFLLKFVPDCAKRIAYASSFGTNVFDQRYTELYSRELKKFAALSVRESSGARLVSDLAGRSAEPVLDPTLLLSLDDWQELAIKPKIDKKYILCYFLKYSFDPQPYADILAKDLKRRTGYDLVMLSPDTYKLFDPKVHAVYDAGPREFLGWFAYASIVLTTSFHGTAFAVNFGKPLLSLINDKSATDCRQKDFLENVGLGKQLLPVNSEMPDLAFMDFERSVVDRRLEDLRIRSHSYLRAALDA